jgi:NAD(P)-dependent dehydrogenase (short-subunit alcohol dehydrogenase family)
MAVQYGARGIRANCVCPGPVATGVRAHSLAILGPGVPDMSGRGVAVNDEMVRALVPMGARGTPENIADAVGFLASEASAYVNGHALVVDGGWRAK